MADEDLFYRTYGNAGLTPMLLIPALVMNVITVPGTLMNLSIIYVTVKYRSLRGTSSFLLAFSGFCEVVHLPGHLVSLWLAISGQNFIAYELAFKWLVFPMHLCATSQVVIALTGLDRLLQVAFPKLHNRLKPRFYLPFLTLFALVIGGIPNVGFFKVAREHPSIPQTGIIKDLLIYEFGDTMIVFLLCMMVACICSYVAVWAVVRLNTSTSSLPNGGQANQHLLRSLAMIVSINVGSYLSWGIFMVLFMNFVVDWLHLNQIHIWVFQMVFAIILNLGVSLNAMVLYFCSQEYRKCFRRELARVFSRFKVAPQQQQQQQNAIGSTIKQISLHS